MKKYEMEYKTALNQYLQVGEDNIFLFFKGRVALYALLRAMNVGPGDEVLVQGYTCVVVANAILYLGATPIYTDIDEKTFNVNLDALKSQITEKTKVIICQNTYGLSSNLEALTKISQEAEQRYGHRIYTLEDCTHGFGGTYHGKPNGTFCDASFFSTQWNKPFTTGVGGFAVVHSKELRNRMEEVSQKLIEPSIKEKIELKIMYFVRQYIINDLTYWPMVRFYRVLSRKNIVLGSSSGEEVEGTKMPEGYFKAQSVTQFKKGIKSLRKLPAVNAKRLQNAKIYTEYLKMNGLNHVAEDLFSDHIFIRYPLLVKNREKFRDEAEKAKIALGEWFEGPVYPCYDNLEVWKVREKEIPVAMHVCKCIVNLPTDERNPEKVIRFLEMHKEDILPAK